MLCTILQLYKSHFLIHKTMIHIKWLPTPLLLKDPTGSKLLQSILTCHLSVYALYPNWVNVFFFLNQFVQMKNYHKAVVLKVWVRVSETLLEVPEILSGDFWGLFRGSMGSNYFHNKILFSFSFLFYHEYSLEFSKVYMTCDDIIAVTASWIYACVLLCFKIYQFSFQIQ